MKRVADRESSDQAMLEERMVRVEKLLRGAAEFTPDRAAPADLVERALLRVPIRRIGARLPAMGAAMAAIVAILGLARTLTASKVTDGGRTVQVAGGASRRDSMGNQRPDRLQPTNLAQQDQSGSSKPTTGRAIVVQNPHTSRNAARFQLARRAPRVAWREQSVRRNDTGLLAPTYLVEPDQEQDGWRIEPAFLRIPLEPVSDSAQTGDSKSNPKPANWGSRPDEPSSNEKKENP